MAKLKDLIFIIGEGLDTYEIRDLITSVNSLKLPYNVVVSNNKITTMPKSELISLLKMLTIDNPSSRE